MPERLKQETNNEFFEVKPLGEENLMEMKAAAKYGIARSTFRSHEYRPINASPISRQPRVTS